MKLGIGLPTILVPELNRGLFLDWARAADDAGFHVFGTIDKPNYDGWDNMVALAAAAAVTERVRLATTIYQLPNRNEIQVAKQAATIDRLSGGRLDLGVAVGAREEDYQVLGARTRFAKRGKRIETQIRKIRRTWRAAKKGTAEAGVLGPAPMQKPLPPIWLGGTSDAAVERAVSVGDGIVYGAIGPSGAATLTPRVRGMVDAAGKKKFTVAQVAYCAIADDPADALDRGSRYVARYYGPGVDPESKMHAGSLESLGQIVKAYEQAGVDVLILFPVIPDVKQVQMIGDQILPDYRVPTSG